ncbi:MAG: IclR family transcriptional regulator, partial [Anaerolineales bacterium]
KVIGAISVSGPASRLTRKRSIEIGSQASAAALEISKRMGYRP